jgi:hypothetical protein
MRRLLAFFLLFLPLLVRAQEIVLDQYGCSVTLPAAWVRGDARKLPTGEMILQASRADTDQIFVIVVLPNIPTNDVESPGVASRAAECIANLGYKAPPPELKPWKGTKCWQFMARRPDAAAAGFIAIARAVLSNKTIYLTMMIGRGDEEKAKDLLFMQLMDSFQLLDIRPPEGPSKNDPLYGTYEIGAYICGGVVVVLLILYSIMLLATRRRGYH